MRDKSVLIVLPQLDIDKHRLTVNAIPYHHFISGNEAHTDDTRETRRQKITRPTKRNIKTQKTQNTQ